MAVTFPLTGSGDATASARTRNAATRDGTHVQAIDLDPPGSATLTNVALSSNANVTLASASTARCRLIVVNESDGALLVKYGATATATSYSRRVAPGAELVLDPPCYQGRVDAILPSGSGDARVTEEAYS